MSPSASEAPRVWLEADDENRPRLAEAIRAGGGTLAPLELAEAIVWAADRPHDLQLRLHPGIRWVQLWSAGIEDWFAAGVIDDQRQWTAAKGVYSRPVAEYVVAMLLAGARSLSEVIRTRRWEPRDVRTLAGATVGILGAGGIGAATVELLRPLGSHVLAVTRGGRTIDGAAESLGVDGIDRVVAESDFLVLAAPDTSATRRLLDARRFELMNRRPWIVNVGRGTLIDTNALVEALLAGKLRGAALDVTDPEPLPEDHPLWALPNVIITAHTANTSALGASACAARVRDNVSRFRSHEPLLGLVDVEHGY